MVSVPTRIILLSKQLAAHADISQFAYIGVEFVEWLACRRFGGRNSATHIEADADCLHNLFD